MDDHAARVRAAYDQLAPVYDAAFKEPKSQAEYAMAFRWLRRAGYLGGRVLDLACGTGALLDHAPVEPHRYLGIDLSPEMIVQARRKFPRHDFAVQDMESLTPEVHGRFSAIVCAFGGFSYCEDPEALVHRLHRMMLSSATIALMPYGTSYLAYERERFRGTAFDEVRPRAYTAEELRRVMSRCLSLREVRGLVGPLGLRAARHLPLPLAARALDLESRTLGRRLPDVFHFLVGLAEE